jgi:hypothetical protein
MAGGWGGQRWETHLTGGSHLSVTGREGEEKVGREKLDGPIA